MSSGFLLTRSDATYISIERLAKILLKNEQVLPLKERLSDETGTGKDLGIL